jgi:hypothetical protein
MAPSTPVADRHAPNRTAECRREFEEALPRIQAHAEVVFRFVRCVHRRAGYIAESIALAWKWWLRLRARGKNPTEFVSAIAGYATRAARSGRRLCGHERAKDVMSPVAQRNCGFCVNSLPPCSTLNGNPFDEALQDNTRTPVDEQVAFRFDFPAWLLTHSDRNRRIIADLMTGDRTLDISRKHGTSPGRVSQLRREFHHDWHLFLGDLP